MSKKANFLGVFILHNKTRYEIHVLAKHAKQAFCKIMDLFYDLPINGELLFIVNEHEIHYECNLKVKGNENYIEI